MMASAHSALLEAVTNNLAIVAEPDTRRELLIAGYAHLTTDGTLLPTSKGAAYVDRHVRWMREAV